MSSIALRNFLIIVLILTNLTTLYYLNQRESTKPPTEKKKAPQRVPAKVMVRDQYRTEVVSPALEEKGIELEDCYNRFLKTASKNYEGRIQVKWTISESGKIDGLEMVKSEFEDKDLHHCVLVTVKNWTFSRPPDGKPYEVSHRFLFRNKATTELTF